MRQRTYGTSLIVAASLVLMGGIGSVLATTSGDLPIDEIPGLRRSASGVLLDDSIALYEEYLRARLIASCMEDLGFHHEPVIYFPSSARVAIADRFAMDLPGEAGARPAQEAADINAAAVANMTIAGEDRYSQALVGESRQDLRSFEETGVVPADVDATSFARGGCTGRAWDQLPGIWELRRNLEPALQEVASVVERSANEQLSRCLDGMGLGAENSAADLEQAVLDGEIEATEAETCMVQYAQEWNAQRPDIEREFIQAHEDELSDHVAYYRALEQTMQHDRGFRAYLATQGVADRGEQAAGRPGQ